MNKILSSENFITDAVNEYSDTIYRIAYNITQNREDAFDVCQEVFVRLIHNRHKIKNDQHLKSWLIRTAVNCSKSNCTQAYKRHSVGFEEVKESEYTLETGAETLLDTIAKLPEKYRTVIHLHYYNDLKIEEIAKILSITKSGVKTRLTRGRKLLKQLIEKENSYEK